MNREFAQERFRDIPKEEVEEIYRNPRLEIPFDPKDMVMFADKKGGDLNLRVLPYHHRSADLGISTVIHERDKKRHHVYSQIDIKGGGFMYPEGFESLKDDVPAGSLAGAGEAFVVPRSKEYEWDYNPLGFMDRRVIDRLTDAADELSADGMRVEGVAGAYTFEYLYLDGEKVSVQDFKKRVLEDWKKQEEESQGKEKKEWRKKIKDFNEQFEPIIVIRLMRSVFRVRDFRDADSTQAQAMVAEACKNLTYESEALGEGKKFEAETRKGQEEWLRFINYWYGKNLGIMQTKARVHGYLHMGNVTLAGEIVDLDSVERGVVTKEFKGNANNKQRWLNAKREELRGESYADQASFKETETGCAFISPDDRYRTLDERFGLPKNIVKDFRDLCFSLGQLYKQTAKKLSHGRDIEPNVIVEEIVRGYEEGLGEKSTFEDIGVTVDQLKKVFRQIARDILIKGVHYNPISPDEKKK